MKIHEAGKKHGGITINKKTVDYLNGKLFPMILQFSIPAAILLLITAIYNIVDRMFVGNYVGTSALAGLSVCFPLPSVIITVLRQVVFLVPFIYVLPVLLNINGIFFAQPISDMLATLLSLYLVWKESRRMGLEAERVSDSAKQL